MAVLPVNLRNEIIYGTLLGPVSWICIQGLGIYQTASRRNSEHRCRFCLVNGFVHNPDDIVYVTLSPLVEGLSLPVFLEKSLVVPDLFVFLGLSLFAGSLKSVRIEIVVDVEAVKVIFGHDFRGQFPKILPNLRLARIPVKAISVLLHKFRLFVADIVRTPRKIHLAYSQRIYPGVNLHSKRVRCLNRKCKRIISRTFARSIRKAWCPLQYL